MFTEGAEPMSEDQPLSNRKARTEVIQETARELAILEAEKKVIVDKINVLKTANIKGVLGMTMRAFNANYALYKLEEDVQSKFALDFRECWNALKIGAQLDWVEAAEAAEADRQEAPVKTDSPRAPGRVPPGPDWSAGNSIGATNAGYIAQMGREAGLAGKNRDDNPMPEGSASWQVWDQNWLEGQEELAKGFGEGQEPPPPAEEAVVIKRGPGRPRKAEGAATAPYTRKTDESLFH
jgi:hypothetical protein